MSEKILLGYGSGVSKKGKDYLSLQIAFPYSEKAIANGFVGYNVQTKFANPILINELKPDMINKKIEIGFGCNDNGFPEINSIKVVK